MANCNAGVGHTYDSWATPQIELPKEPKFMVGDSVGIDSSNMSGFITNVHKKENIYAYDIVILIRNKLSLYNTRHAWYRMLRISEDFLSSSKEGLTERRQ